MAIPSYEESVAALPNPSIPEQSPSLLSRAGEQLANAPSNALNDLFRLYYNLGVSPRATEPVQVPKPYDIPEAKTLGESGIDLGANLLEALPWFLTGEGAGAGIARLAEAGPLVTNISKLAGGFALQGLTESKEQAAESGALGAGFGAVEKIPGIRNRLLASFLLGGGSAALAKLHGASNTQAGISGATNVLLPFFGGFAKKGFAPIAREAEEANYPATLRSGPGYRENIGLTEPLPPVQGPDLAAGYNREIGLREIPGTGQPPSRFELNGNVAPEGSLIREPVYTEGEALTIAEARKQAAQRLMPARTEPTAEQPFLPLGPPDGSLIREPTFTAGEMSKFLARRPVENGKVVEFPSIAPDGLVVSATEPAKPPVPPVPPIPPRAPFEPEPPRSPRSPRSPQIEPPKEEVATLQPESAANAKAPSVKLKDVISPDNEAHAHAAAEKLGMEYQGTSTIPGYGSLMEFKFKSDSKHAAANANISFRAGGTYKTLKNLAQKKIQLFEDGEKTKVATLQQTKAKPAGAEPGSAAASQSLSFLESKPTTVPQADLPQGLEVGDKAIGHIPDPENFEADIPTVGTIHPTVEPGTVRFQDSNGDVYDLHPSKISRGINKPPVGPIESVGGMADVEKATKGGSAESIELPGGGTKKRSTFGRGGIDKPSEQANISHEAMFAMARYIVAPAIGAGVGAATGSREDAWSRAVIGAIIGGAAGVLGGKAFRALLENPSKAAKAATTKFEAFKAEVKTAGKVATASEKLAAEAASDWPGAGSLDKMARWMNKNFVSNMVIAKLLDRAHGKVEYLSQMMGLAVDGLKNHKDINLPQVSDAIGKYFDGTMPFATLQRIVPREVADLAALADKTRTNLQNILIEGIGDTRLGNQIKNSIGQYLTTTYRIFHDPKYTPTDTQIAAAVKSMSGMFESFDVGMKEIREYIHEIKTNRKMFGSIGGAKGEALGSILARTEGLTPEFKQMLGIYDNPVERIAFTGMKLVNGAKSAEFFNEVAGARKANGLKYAYERSEWDRTVATLQQQAGHDPVAAAKLQELQTYVYNSGGNSNGKLSNMIMDVKTRDQLANYDAASRMFQSPIANAIAQVTNRIKYGKIILSPLQLSRQIIQLPILGMISRTGPAQWMEAFRILRQRSMPVGSAGRAEYDRLLRLGVLTGDPVGGMFRKDMQAMIDGSLDSKLTQRLGKYAHNWEEIWRTPDLIIRASAFLKKEAELLDQGHKAVDATERALEHMNRYTMNYGAVPPIIAKGRQLPFVNQYLSWTYETLRITKNLMEDAKGGDVYAMGVLSTLGTIPFIVQAASESSLSPEDRKAWNQTKALSPDWNRGNFKFVVGRNADGSFRYIDYTPLVIHDQFFRMMKGILSGDKDLTMASNPVFGWQNTPLLNVAKIGMSTTDNYGRPTDTLMEKMQATRREILPTLLGTELDRLKNAVTPNEDGGFGITDKRSGTVNSITDILQTYVTSMRPYTVKPEYLKKQAVAETMDHLRQQQSLLRKTLATNASQDVKDEARQQFKAARDEILKSFRDKLGITDQEMMAGQ